MERKQVSLDLDTPALRPTSQLGGQYSVAVQATPKTNSALQLAQALRYTPQVLGQASNIAKQLGAEAAATVDNVEDAMLDDETKGILGYDKAYQQGLVKRHFSMNEEAIKERFRNIASDPDALKMSPDEFLGRLGAERQEFNNELMDSFGGNANREQAIQALSSTFVDELVDATSSEWVANKKQQTEMLISGDTQALFSTQGVAKGLAYMSEEYGRLGMAPKERAQKMRGAVTANVSTLIAEGKVREASRILAEAEQYKLGGKHGLFGSTEGAKERAVLLNSLERAEKANRVDDDAPDEFAAIFTDALAGLRGASELAELSETQKKVMKNLFELVHPTSKAEEIDELIAGVFEGGGLPNQNLYSMVREGAVNNGDSVYTLWNESRGKVDYYMERINNRPMPIHALTPKVKEKALDEFKEYHSNNPTKDQRDWITETEQNIRPFPELAELSNELNAGNYVMDTLEWKTIGKDLKNTINNVADNMEVEFNGTLASTMQSDIERYLLEYAHEVADQPDSLELLRKKKKELLQDTTERLNGLAKASQITISETTASDVDDISSAPSKVTNGRNDKTKYKTLEWDSDASVQRSGNPQRRGQKKSWENKRTERLQLIQQEREQMVKNNHRPQLRRSLYRHGFTSYSPSNVEMLNVSGLDAGDVRLFSNGTELNKILIGFADVLEKDTGLNKLTDEEKKIREQYQALGVSDMGDLERLHEIQGSLLNQ